MTLEELHDLQEDFNINMHYNYIILYHATAARNAEQIINSQFMFGKENGLFFSTKPDKQIQGYGDTIIEVQIPFQKLELDDQFSDELHFRMPCKPFIKYHIEARLF
jgi:hypothetical protein